MSRKVVVVLRQVVPEAPVAVSLVTEIPEDIDSIHGFCNETMVNNKARVVQDYPEFKDARFWYEIKDLNHW